MVDLLRPGQRLRVARNDEVGRVVHAFNKMLDRLESERQQSGRRVLAAQEAERVGIARDLHDEVGQVLTGVLLQLDSIAGAAPDQREEVIEARAVRREGATLELLALQASRLGGTDMFETLTRRSFTWLAGTAIALRGRNPEVLIGFADIPGAVR